MSVRRTPWLLLGLLSCASGPAVDSGLHGAFADLRPAMVAVRVEGPEGPAEALSEALYRGLLERDYSVLAPGAPAGSEAGFFRARLLGEAPPWDAEALFEDPFGTVLFRCRVSGFEGEPANLAALLLGDLPPKR